MEQLAFVSKSSEKSSPSFPEDVEDDEEEPLELDPPGLKRNSEAGAATTATTSTAGEVVDMVVVSDSNPTDVTMLAEDEEEDDLEEGGGDLGGVRDDAGGTTSIGSELTRSFTLNSVDSPRHPADSSEKKVHWSNHHVQTLLDCVEKHLDEFNIQKKHKQVWQTIGGEMESFGFTMEHCYNKWKNLRRDVRLLVNNPQKVVRNADILRRVARLILVIHPNIDATTMQVTGTGCASLLGDRNGRSAPNTPGGGGLSSRGFVSSSLHGPNSPRYPMNSSSTTNTPNSHHYHHHHHHSLASGFRHTPNGSGGGITSEDLKSLKREGHEGQAPPSTALFINLGPECDALPEHSQPQQSQQAVMNHHQQHLSGQPQSSHQQQQSLLASVVSDVAAAAVAAAAAATTTASDETMTTTTSTSFPFFFSPAAAALLVQSQLLNDLIRQQQQPQQQHGDEHMPLVSSETVVTGAHAAASTPKPVAATNGSVCHQHNHQPQPMQFEIHQQHQSQQPTPDVVTLATTLLNGLSSVAAAASAATTDHSQQQQQAQLQPPAPQHLPGIGQTPLLPPILATTSGAATGSTSSNVGGGGNSLLLGCQLPPGTELAGVVERLRDEETVHLRLTDCVSHLANELRAAGLRRRQALDQLLVLLQAARLHQTVAPAAASLMTSTKQAATSVTTPTITKQTSSHD